VIYANEIDPVACAVLRHCGMADHVDERSIKLVRPDDLRPFRRAHFFAGAGLWEVACRLAGWPPYLPLWSASCPCQPFSAAGKQLGTDDPRHLWPDLFRLVDAERPACIVGEQVAGKAGDAWLDGVCADLESIGYAVRAVEVPASAVDSPQKRSRNWWVAMADCERWFEPECGYADEMLVRWDSEAGTADSPSGPSLGRSNGTMASADSRGCGWRQEDAQWGTRGRNAAEWVADTNAVGNARGAGLALGSFGEDQRRALRDERPSPGAANSGSFWRDSYWLDCADGKSRRAPNPESYFRDVAHGLSSGVERFDPARLLVPSFKGRTEAWRLAGNAIVPWVAAMVLSSILETT
jgi:DNA (cytosine-5)-methyltransferase 1